MRNIGIFCGSSIGVNPEILDNCRELAGVMNKRRLNMVYGAAKIGLMGVMAEELQRNGSKVIGVIPRFLMTKEVVNEELDDLIITDNMHDRKVLMYDKSDGFVILPGGFGTMDEFFEITTWGQLGLHQKPIGILNAAGFYDNLILQFQQMVESGFLKQSNLDVVLIDKRPDKLLDKMAAFKPRPVPKWLNKEQV